MIHPLRGPFGARRAARDRNARARGRTIGEMAQPRPQSRLRHRIATGYATLGQVGFEKRREYTAIREGHQPGARLCGEARADQIVISQRVFDNVQAHVEAPLLRELNLKGFNRPVPAYEVLSWREDGADTNSSAAVAPGAT